MRRLGWLVAAISVLLVALWLAVPPLLMWQLPLRASEALGRSVTLGAVEFRPWAMSLSLTDLAIAGASPSSEPLLRVGRLHANVSAASLLRLAPVVEALEVDALRLRVARIGEGRYDIDDLITRFTPNSDIEPADPLSRFALYNLQVRDAQIRFDDGPVKRVQQIDALNLALPFLSSLSRDIEIKVEPRLAFRLNGTAFDSGAQATPFAPNRSGVLKLAVTDLDLVPYIGYLPSSLPAKVMRGRLSADLNIGFAAPPGSAPNVRVNGAIGLDDVALTDTAGAPLIAWKTLKTRLLDAQPLMRRLAFDNLQVAGLTLHATRDAAGTTNLSALMRPRNEATRPALLASAASAALAATGVASPMAASGASASAAASAAAAAAAASGASKTKAGAWQASLESLALTDAHVVWNDSSVQPAAALQLDFLKIEAGPVQWPIVKPVPVSLQGELRSQTAGAPALARFTVEGPITDRDAKLAVRASGLSLAGFAPYLSQAFAPAVNGQLAVQAQLDWSGAVAAPRSLVMLKSLVLDNLQVREASSPKGPDAVAIRQLALADVTIDLLARSVAVGTMKMSQPAVQVVRNEDGRLNVLTWAVVGALPSAAPDRTLPAPSAPPGWRVRLEDLLLEGGQLRFTDAVSRRGTGEPVRVELSELRVAVQNFEWQGAKGKSPADVQFNARVGGVTRDRQRPAGSVDYKGKLGLEPMLANGSLRVERVPVQLFKPYFAELVQLTLLRAEVGYDGSIDLRRLPAGLDLVAAGDALLGDVHIASLPEAGRAAVAVDAEELLNWQSLALKGVKLAIKPAVRPRVEIGEAALTDFYSRLVITDQGRFNLQDVAGARGGALTPSAGASAPLAIVDAPRPDAASVDAPRAAAPASAPARAGGGLPLDLKIGATRLTNGRIDFTDRFVRPNYSAALTELNGRFGAFESGSREMATLSLRGRAAGTALLEIDGKLNPTVEPLALDIRAKATDLELAPLSPYAGKYAGYAIERGKLSMDVTYKIDADGRLDARNRVVLNQLTFGEKIESKDATTLPVRLAVALLKDRNGVIDVDLPVSGSVNDPQFSVGAVVWKVLVNLLTRAVTAPFSLLAGAGAGAGSSEDLSAVEFRPGTAEIAPAGAAAIDKVAKALADRPALKMTITGATDPAAEREAFQTAALDARLVAEQRRRAPQTSAAASGASAPESLGGEERTRLLSQLYKATELPNKPRNALGLMKDLPAAEMEALLKARAPVSDEAMRELAVQRGLAVRDALLAKGLGSERIFLAAPKLRVSGDGEANRTPHAQLALSVN